MKVGLYLLMLVLVSPALAHEVRPAYLELHETRANEFQVLWKVPMLGDLRLALKPVFSGQTKVLTPIVSRQANSALIQTWRLQAIDPLPGQSVGIAGLDSTMTDALVRIAFLDGSHWVKRLSPAEPEVVIPRQSDEWSVTRDYLKLGVEHILLGVDHLMFVLALLLITHGGWVLVKTITAFTIAHSLTLTTAALGFVRVPVEPIEAIIALSIVFVASEIVHAHRGRSNLTSRAPWIMAFAFGLLHGFGFAGALSEVGLPTVHIPLALLFFNIGVEVGQLLFVAVIICLIWVIRRVPVTRPRWARLAPAYVIGSLAMFWVMQRLTVF